MHEWWFSREGRFSRLRGHVRRQGPRDRTTTLRPAAASETSWFWSSGSSSARSNPERGRAILEPIEMTQEFLISFFGDKFNL